jgi:hypothetical protein
MERLVKSVLSSADLPLAELCAARLDGEVYGVDRCFSPIDEVPSRLQRAAAVASAAPRGLTAELATAAWVHGATFQPPNRHSFCVDLDKRAGNFLSAVFTVRERRLRRSDIVNIGELKLTSPLETAVDILRGEPFFDHEHDTVDGLLRLGGVDAAACRDIIASRPPSPGNRRARNRLNSWAET